MPKKKKPDVYALHANQYWQQHEWAALVRERYPAIKSISIDVELKDPDIWPGDPAPRKLTFTPTSKAFFRMQCPYRECIRGGFDFSGGVSKAIESDEQQAIGYVLCDGWQDQERINRHRCLLKANYKIVVE